MTRMNSNPESGDGRVGGHEKIDNVVSSTSFQGIKWGAVIWSGKLGTFTTRLCFILLGYEIISDSKFPVETRITDVQTK